MLHVLVQWEYDVYYNVYLMAISFTPQQN